MSTPLMDPKPDNQARNFGVGMASKDLAAQEEIGVADSFDNPFVAGDYIDARGFNRNLLICDTADGKENMLYLASSAGDYDMGAMGKELSGVDYGSCREYSERNQLLQPIDGGSVLGLALGKTFPGMFHLTFRNSNARMRLGPGGSGWENLSRFLSDTLKGAVGINPQKISTIIPVNETFGDDPSFPLASNTNIRVADEPKHDGIVTLWDGIVETSGDEYVSREGHPPSFDTGSDSGSQCSADSDHDSVRSYSPTSTGTGLSRRKRASARPVLYTSSLPSSSTSFPGASDDRSDSGDSFTPAKAVKRKARRSMAPRAAKMAKVTQVESEPAFGALTMHNATKTARPPKTSSAAKRATASTRTAHSRKKFPCTEDNCDQICNSLGDLRRHLESLIHRLPSHKCECNKVFTRRDALARHQRSSCKPGTPAMSTADSPP